MDEALKSCINLDHSCRQIGNQFELDFSFEALNNQHSVSRDGNITALISTDYNEEGEIEVSLVEIRGGKLTVLQTVDIYN